jgi:hypothetical protein
LLQNQRDYRHKKSQKQKYSFFIFYLAVEATGTQSNTFDFLINNECGIESSISVCIFNSKPACMQDAEHLEELLQKWDANPEDEAVSWELYNFLRALLQKEHYVRVITIAFRSTYDTGNFKRALYLIRESCPDNELYLLMMDFILDKFESVNDTEMKEAVLEATLDVFWHRREGLENLDANGQGKLNRLLNFAATYRTELIDDHGGLYEYSDLLFPAINQSMDLIIYQKEFGNSPVLIDLYLNHYDRLVVQRAHDPLIILENLPCRPALPCKQGTPVAPGQIRSQKLAYICDPFPFVPVPPYVPALLLIRKCCFPVYQLSSFQTGN